jgi:hypothetical protein
MSLSACRRAAHPVRRIARYWRTWSSGWSATESLSAEPTSACSSTNTAAAVLARFAEARLFSDWRAASNLAGLVPTRVSACVRSPTRVPNPCRHLDRSGRLCIRFSADDVKLDAPVIAPISVGGVRIDRLRLTEACELERSLATPWVTNQRTTDAARRGSGARPEQPIVAFSFR